MKSIKVYDYPVGYVSLAILREEYKEYIKLYTENGQYKGDLQNLVKYETLDKILRPINIS